MRDVGHAGRERYRNVANVLGVSCFQRGVIEHLFG